MKSTILTILLTSVSFFVKANITDLGLFDTKADTLKPTTRNAKVPVSSAPFVISPAAPVLINDNVGKTAPAISAKNLNGENFSESFPKGHAAVLFFWTPDSLTNKDILGGFNTLSQNHGTSPAIVFLALAKGEESEVKQFLEEHLILARVTMKNDNNIKAFNIKNFPTIVVVNKEGKIVYHQVALDKYFVEDANKAIVSSL